MRKQRDASEIIDITADMTDLFVRFDIQRRLSYIISCEEMAEQFGMEEPDSLK